jgi:hypothetical protein
MSQPPPDATEIRGAARKGVLCYKCEHLNSAELKSCGYCGARLYINCKHCGETNQRVVTRCVGCGRRLHRSWWKSRLRKLEKAVLGRRQRITLFQVVLLVLAVYAAYKVIVRIVEYEPPPPA